MSVDEKIFSASARNNLRALAAKGFLLGANNSIYNVIWQPYALALGATVPVLGVLASIGGWFGLITNFVQPLGGWIADRIGRKPVMILAGVFSALAFFMFALAGPLSLLPLIFVGVILLAISALGIPASASLVAESAHHEKQASAFSTMQVAVMLPGIIAPTLGGFLADRFGHAAIFPALIAIELAAMLVIWRKITETRAVNRNALNRGAAWRMITRAFVPPRGLRGFFLAVAMDSFFWGIGWGLLYGMLVDNLHFTTQQLGIMSSMSAISWTTTQLPIGRYLDRRGARWMLIISQSLGIPLILIWMTQSRFEIFALAQLLFGLSASTWAPVINLHLARVLAENERAETFGRLNAFRGLIGFPAGAIGGLLYAFGGMTLPLLVNLIGIVLIVIVLSFWVRDPIMERA
ncbi:MAG: MFS transporter [Chloroflexi bacterium]|nr:MFS transporter [Chloroflexota bacterium]